MVVVGIASVIGLQTARAFHARGVRVIGVAGQADHYAARTRACERVVVADVHGPGFLDVLAELGDELAAELSEVREPGLPGPVLVPCTDRAVLVVAEHAESLRRWYEVPLAPAEVVRRLVDKAEFAALADELGLPTPPTVTVRSRADVEEAVRTLRFPAVVKPSVKSDHWRHVTRAKVCLVHDAAQLRELCTRVGRAAGTLVVQEFVGGGDDELLTTNSYVDRRGRTLVAFTSRKRRQWPPGLGIASYAAPAPDTDVPALAARLFEGAGFHGLAYLEVKHEAATGRRVLIEANVGRPTGRSAMAEANGVEILLTMYADATGAPLPPAARRRQGPGGAAWVNVRRDALAVAAARRRGEMTWTTWLRELRGPVVHAVWSVRDPAPFMMEVCHSSRRAWDRALARRRALRAQRGSEAALDARTPPAALPLPRGEEAPRMAERRTEGRT